MAKKKTVKRNASNNKRYLLAACCVAGLLLVIGIGVLIYKETSKNEGNVSKTAPSGSEGDDLADGEIFDYEKAGYLKLGTYKGLVADVQPEEDEIYAGMIDGLEEEEEEAEEEADGNETQAPQEETEPKEAVPDIVEDGDLVKVDFTGRLNGEKLDDASATDTYVWIGKKQFVDDFEKGIIGIENGKKKTIDCKFPSDYDDGELAGKTVQFTIKVTGRFGVDAAKRLSDGACSTVQEYYEYEKKKQLEDNQSSKGELVWDTLKEDTKVEAVPENMLAQAEADTNQMYTNFAEYSGMTLQELLESFEMDENGVAEMAQDTVVDIMIAKTIAAKEGVTMDDEYYKKALREVLVIEESDGDKSIEAMEKEYRESQGSHPKDDMLVERIKDFIGEYAKEN